MSSVGAATLYFPARDVIIASLTKHPRTCEPYLTKTKMIETVAEFFANTHLTSREVKKGLKSSLNDLNKTLKLPQGALKVFRRSLNSALYDCASEQMPEAEKSYALVAKL
jgi:hypothetical protein